MGYLIAFIIGGSFGFSICALLVANKEGER